jgi:predicted Rossmann fold nucleotide-binding protein DprA/Smf involved in DNA uptake
LEEIVEGLGPVPQGAMEASLFVEETDAKPQAASNVAVVQLSDQQRVIVEHLGTDPLGIDSIIERTSIPAHVVMQELTMLSLKGVVRRIDGQMFVRVGSAGSAATR